MKKLILIALIGIFLSGCTPFLVRRMDIEQGNIITQEDLRKIKPGISEKKVRAILGDPVLVNVFSPNRLDYVYTFQRGHDPICIKRVNLTFRRGILTGVYVQ